MAYRQGVPEQGVQAPVTASDGADQEVSTGGPGKDSDGEDIATRTPRRFNNG